MFNPGDTAYFVFRGNWNNGCYKGYYCLCSDYFPFTPVKIIRSRISPNYGLIYDTELWRDGPWKILAGCLEGEFSFSKFVLAHLEWNKRISTEQFQRIVSTLGR